MAEDGMKRSLGEDERDTREDVTGWLGKSVRQAIADEWFAQYQYWVGVVIIDAENEDVIQEFVQHEGDEWDHATDLAFWLQGIPNAVKIPRGMRDIVDGPRHCGYIQPVENTRSQLLRDGMQGERCAIGFYEMIVEKISDKYYYGPDIGTLLEEILTNEKEHLRDLEKL